MCTVYQAAPKWQSAASAKKIETAYLRMTAPPGFFRFLASHYFFSGLRILNFLNSQGGAIGATFKYAGRNP